MRIRCNDLIHPASHPVIPASQPASQVPSQPPIHQSIHPSIHPSIYNYPSSNSFIHSFIHLFIHSFIHDMVFECETKYIRSFLILGFIAVIRIGYPSTTKNICRSVRRAPPVLVDVSSGNMASMALFRSSRLVCSSKWNSTLACAA